MTVAKGRAIRSGRRPAGWVTGVRLPASALKAPATALVRLLFGAGGGYRTYRREGFPEHELHQILAGKKDRFDGLL